jgi:Na+/H+ antiporter NhaD/arsenite permease-like protein
MDKISRGIILIGVGLIMAAILLVLPGLGAPDLITVMISVAVALISVTLVKNWRASRGEILQDERTRNIHNRAMSFSWWFAYLMITAVFLLENSGVVHIPIEAFAGIMIFMMLFSYLMARQYLSWRGDV